MSVSTAPTTPSTATSLATPNSVFSSGCQLDDAESTAPLSTTITSSNATSTTSSTTSSSSSTTSQSLHSKHLLGHSRKSLSQVLPILNMPTVADVKVTESGGGSSGGNDGVLDDMFDMNEDEEDDYDDDDDQEEEEELDEDDEEMMTTTNDEFLEAARNGVDNQSEMNNRSEDGEVTDSTAGGADGDRGCASSDDLDDDDNINNNNNQEENGDMFTSGENDLDDDEDEEERGSIDRHNDNHHSLNHHHHRDRLLGASSFSDDLLNNMDSENQSELESSHHHHHQEYNKIEGDDELLYQNNTSDEHDLNHPVTEASSSSLTTTLATASATGARMVSSKVRKRSANQAYEYLTCLPDSHSFQEWITQNETDFTWVHKRNSMTNIGKKFYYICNFRIKKGFHKCPAVIYALFPSTLSPASCAAATSVGSGSLSALTPSAADNQNMVVVYSCGEHDHRRLPNFAESLGDSGIVGDQTTNEEDGYSSSPKNLSPSSMMSGGHHQQKVSKQGKQQSKRESNGGVKRLSSSSSTNLMIMDGSSSNKYRRMGNGERGGGSTPEASLCDNNNNSSNMASFYADTDVDKNNNNVGQPDEESIKKDEEETRASFLNKAFLNANSKSNSVEQVQNQSRSSPTTQLNATLSSALTGLLNPTAESLAARMHKSNGGMDEKVIEALRAQWMNKTSTIAAASSNPAPPLAPPQLPPPSAQAQLLLQMIAQAQAQGKFPTSNNFGQQQPHLQSPLPSITVTTSNNGNSKPIKQSNGPVNNNQIVNHANLTKKQLQAKLAHSEQMLMQQQRQLSQINGTINQLDGGNEFAGCGGMNNRSPTNGLAASNNQIKRIMPGSPQMAPNGNGLMPPGMGLLNDLKQGNGGAMIQTGNGLVMANSPTPHLNGLHQNGVDFLQQQQQSHNNKQSSINGNKKHHQHKELSSAPTTPTNMGNFSPNVPFKLIHELNSQSNGASIANILLQQQQQQHQSNMLSSHPHHHHHHQADMNAVNNAAAAAAAAHLTNMELAKLINSTNLLMNKPTTDGGMSMGGKNGMPSPLLSVGSSPVNHQLQQVNLLEQLLSAGKVNQQQQQQQQQHQQQQMSVINRLPRAAPLSLETVPIHLDVGGHVYTSTLETLCKYPSSRLSKMFNGSLPIVFDTQRQQYFIDRDGKLFRHVLNFMRQGALNLPDNFNDMPSLLAEAKHFELEALYAQLESLSQSKRVNNNNEPTMLRSTSMNDTTTSTTTNGSSHHEEKTNQS